MSINAADGIQILKKLASIFKLILGFSSCILLTLLVLLQFVDSACYLL
jgi:hypothetical protein